MNTSGPDISARPLRLGPNAQLIVIAAMLAAEMLLASYLVQEVPVDSVGGIAGVVRYAQHWLFRFIIAYAISVTLLVYLRGPGLRSELAAAHAPLRMRWVALHVVLVIPFLCLSAILYVPTVPFLLTALARDGLALGAVLALFAALAPLSVWHDIIKKAGALPLFAVLPAAAAVAAIHLSQTLWTPAAALTFRLVKLMLTPILPSLKSDPASLILATDRFAVRIAEVCSGLEGIGLMLAFCVAWLWLHRREYYFPRALIVVPLGVLAVFLLNAVRIAVLVLIGDAGYERVAIVGFHSQAGWIAFNLAAFGVAIIAQSTPWISRVAARKTSPTAGGEIASTTVENPTATFLMPLLAILAAGMVARALSADFELLYPLRLLAAVAVLIVYRVSYARMDWRFSWRGPAVGIAVFALWCAFAAFTTEPKGPPVTLTLLPVTLHRAWIVSRVIAATITVPIAEELSFRGYLMRRLTSRQFETLPFPQVRWPSLALSAVAFGIMHGAFWLPGIIAGLAYGVVAMRTGRLGEAIIAHCTTNALLSAYVLIFGQWQLW